MIDEPTLAYVTSTATLLGIPMDAGRAQRVAGHFQRTRAMAALLDSADLPIAEELAEIFCPEAFKPIEIGREQL